MPHHFPKSKGDEEIRVPEMALSIGKSTSGFRVLVERGAGGLQLYLVEGFLHIPKNLANQLPLSLLYNSTK